MLDENAFETFLAGHHEIIRTYAASLGVPWDSVDEVAHEAFVQYYLGLGRQPADVEPMRWLKGVARHCAMNWFRARKKASRWIELSEVLGPEAEHSVFSESGSLPIYALKMCMASLPEKNRQVLSWFYSDELAAEDIGARLHQSAAAVRMQIMRLRDVLGNCIRRRMSGGTT